MKKNEILFFKIVSDDSMKTYNFLQIKANVAVTCNHVHGIQTLAKKTDR